MGATAGPGRPPCPSPRCWCSSPRELRASSARGGSIGVRWIIAVAWPAGDDGLCFGYALGPLEGSPMTIRVLSFLALFFLLAVPAHADTVYTYTGDYFPASWLDGPRIGGAY